MRCNFMFWFCFGCRFEILLCSSLFQLQLFSYDEFFLQIYSDWLWATNLMPVDSERLVFKQVQVWNKVMWKFQMDRIIGRTLIMYPEIPLRKNTPLTLLITYDPRWHEVVAFLQTFSPPPINCASLCHCRLKAWLTCFKIWILGIPLQEDMLFGNKGIHELLAVKDKTRRTDV